MVVVGENMYKIQAIQDKMVDICPAAANVDAKCFEDFEDCTAIF